MATIQTVKIKTIGPLSLARIVGIGYAIMGLILGFFFAAVSGVAAIVPQQTQIDAVLGLFFGVGAIVFLPVFYGGIGFLGGLISAAVFNVLTKVVGGIELGLEFDTTGPTPSVSTSNYDG